MEVTCRLRYSRFRRVMPPSLRGPTSVTELRNFPWGDRGGRIRDPLGNIWWLTEHIEDVEPELQAQHWADPDYIESVRYAQEGLDQEAQQYRGLP
jgi:hypothetical protein